MVECGICIGEYREGDLELHRKTCAVLLMFRCSICAEDYVSKEGLWKHLNVHEIEEESKELHCQEMKAKHKLHQCALCNDQRAYLESSYWTHVNDAHHGFFLRCYDCGENFRSEERMNAHAFRNCKAKDQAEEDQVSIKVEDINSDAEELQHSRKGAASNANEGNDNQFDGDNSTAKKDIADKSVENPPSGSSGTKCVRCGKEFAKARRCRHHFTQLHQPSKCSICGITFEGAARVRYHKIMKHMKPKYECAKCLKKFNYLSMYKCHANVCNPVQSNFSTDKSSGERIQNNRNDTTLVTESSPSEASCTKCRYCGTEESSSDTLGCHILVHHDPVACDFCGITLDSLSQAQDHMNSMHKESKLKCPHCPMRFRWKIGLQIHVSRCENLKFPCDLCGKMFPSVVSVNRHRSYVCHIYKWRKDQEQKNDKTSLSDADDSSAVMEKISPLVVENGLSQTKCYFCNEEFFSSGYLRHHLKTSHELTRCDICGITVLGLSSAKYHKIKCHKEPKYECLTCEKKFHRIRKFNEHRFMCERKRYLCKLCGRTYKQILSAKHHNKRFHPNETSFKNLEIVQDQNHVQNIEVKMEITVEETTIAGCDDDVKKPRYSCKSCDTTFPRYSQLRYHNRTKHTEAKYQCPHCSRDFHFRKKYEDHSASCAGLKHACELCGQKFHLISRLEKHKKQLHHDSGPSKVGNIEGEDSTAEKEQNNVDKSDTASDISCIICKLTFSTTAEFVKHKHSPTAISKDADDHDNAAKDIEECLEDEKELLTGQKNPTESSECHGSPSKRNESLLRQDAGDQDDSCSICGLTIRSQSSMRYHMIVYHTNPQYKCSYCEKMFHFANVLRRHEKSCSTIQCKKCDVWFPTRRKLNKHKRTCPKLTKGHYDVQSDTEEISLPQGGKETQSNPTNVAQGENTEITLEIKVEETVLQEQEY